MRGTAEPTEAGGQRSSQGEGASRGEQLNSQHTQRAGQKSQEDSEGGGEEGESASEGKIKAADRQTQKRTREGEVFIEEGEEVEARSG